MLRQLPATLLVTVLLLASAGLLGSALLEKNRSDTPVTRIRVGMVGDFDNEYLRFGLAAVQNTDPSRYSIEFDVLQSEDEARAQLLRGTISAYVRIPDTFVESLRHGRVETIRYVAPGGAPNLGAALTDEVVAAVGDLLSSTQDAIYGTQHLVEDKLPKLKSWQAGDALGQRYIEQALDREALFETEILRTPTGLDLAESMLCGLLVLFLMLWGITASGVFARREPELGGMLFARGMGAGRQVAAELGAYLALLLVTLAAVAVPALVVLRTADLSALGLGLSASALTRLIVRLLLTALMTGALQFLLYELATGVIQSVLLQFLAAMALGYASGCLYPLRFFPVAMQAVAQWLPTGCAVAFLGAGLAQEPGVAPGLAMAAYTALFVALAIRLRRARLSRPGL
ncbi:MAG: ABC transporter permease [Oscillospiraceae bacterium]|nr:ABC transporter permease [Oscillospiraceae bacterium]